MIRSCDQFYFSDLRININLKPITSSSIFSTSIDALLAHFFQKSGSSSSISNWALSETKLAYKCKKLYKYKESEKTNDTILKNCRNLAMYPLIKLNYHCEFPIFQLICIFFYSSQSIINQKDKFVVFHSIILP